MAGISLVFLVGFLEKFSVFFLIKEDKQEIKVLLNYFLMAIIFATISFIYYDKLDFGFLEDKFFYVLLILENFVLYISLKNYNKQNSFTQIAFAAFSSIYLIIVISYFYVKLFDMNLVINSPYKDLNEVIIFSTIFFILTIIYFYGKLKTKDIKHPFYLFFYAIFLVNTLFFSLYNIQTHQSFLIYVFIFLSMSSTYYLIYINKHKTLNLKFIEFIKDKKQIKSFLLYIFFYFLTFLSSIIGGNLIAIEFFAIFKRVGQISSSLVIDRFLFKKMNKIDLKDIIVIITIISLVIYIYLKN